MVLSTPRILEQEVSEALEKLLAAAKKATPSPEQQEQQRRSFAYGNTAFENKLITREMIDRQADAIERKRNEQRSR
ncbi:MAG: hypothetical protein ACLPSF_10265 [Methylocella sp.]